MPRANVVLAICKRNFLNYFSGIIGYLFIIVFVVLGAFLAFRPEFFSDNLANLEQLNEYFPQLLLFIIPAITMSVWADERKSGTDELLFTFPVSDLEVLIGKYLAVLGVYTVALLFSVTHLFVLEWIGDPDWGMLLANYFGYWLAGAALLSAGMVASMLTSSTTVAFVLGTLICAVPVYIDKLWPTSQLMQGLSLSEQFRDFGLGILSIGSVLYLISFTLFMLYVNLILIGRRHWSRGVAGESMGLQYLVRAVSAAAILISANVVAANVTSRVDMTAEGLYTVSDTTRNILRNVDDEHPVTIQAFISEQVPREYVPIRTTLLGLLRQYGQIGGSRVDVRIVSVQPYSEQADQAKQYGIQPRQVQTEQGGRIQLESVYLGAVVNSGAKEVVLPFFDVGIPIEYELTRSVKTVSEEDQLTVGILDTDAKLMGGFDMQSFRSSPEWRIVTELRKQYQVEQVSPDSTIDDSKFDVLIAVLPSSLTQNQMVNLAEYVKKGKPVLIFDDPLPVFDGGRGIQFAPRSPKPRPGGPFGGGAPPEPKADDGKATTLLNTLDLAWDNGAIAWDLFNPHPEFEDVVRPELIFISPGSGTKTAFSPNSSVTSGLQEVLLFFPGTLLPRADSEMKFEPLLRTGPRSGVLDWDEVTQPSMFGGVGINENPPRVIDEQAHVIAYHVQSGDDSKQPRNVIWVADTDIISDWIFNVRERELFGLKLDNVPFVLNAVDVLAGEDAFLQLRKRRPKHRTLVGVEAETAKFVEERKRSQEEADEEADEELELAKERFGKEVEKIRNDENLDDAARAQLIRIAQENEQRRVEVTEANIERKKEKKIEQTRAETERKIRTIENRIRYLAILIPPIPAILVGLIFLGTRLQRERRNISPDRRVRG